MIMQSKFSEKDELFHNVSQHPWDVHIVGTCECCRLSGRTQLPLLNRARKGSVWVSIKTGLELGICLYPHP